MSTEFLGKGWAFPTGLDEAGRIRTASGAESIRQAIRTILSTAPGERVMRPDFGCGLHELVFRQRDATMAGRAESAVRDALVRWEPRIDVLDVTATLDPGDPARLLIDVNYRVRSTNSRYNLVYPFYLE